MSTDLSDLLNRFHAVLIEEIRRKRPEYLRIPFTVAEIYQDLVPYRTHRDTLGIEMNGDYEDAILRLLAGESGYLVLDSEAARKQMAAELQSKNPNTGVFREFAAAEVRLNPVFVPTEALAEEAAAVMAAQKELALPAAQPPRPRRPAVDAEQATGANQAPAAGGGTTGATTPAPDVWPIQRLAPDVPPAPSATLAPVVERRATRVEALPGDSAHSGPCAWCGEALPAVEGVHFCPFCGGSRHASTCTSCGAGLQPGWRYCIGCGHERSR